MEGLKPKNKTLKVRIDSPTYYFLEIVAEEMKITLSELVRTIIYMTILEKAFGRKKLAKNIINPKEMENALEKAFERKG